MPSAADPGASESRAARAKRRPRRRTAPRRYRFLGNARVLAALVIVHSGCQSLEKLYRPDPSNAPITKVELTAHLSEFGDRFSAMIAATADDIAAACDHPVTRRNTVLWKLNATQACRSALSHPEPRAAFIDTWTLCIQMRQLFESEAGSNIFGAWTPRAVDTSLKAEEDIRQVGTLFLDETQLGRAESEVRDFAHAHPLSTSYARQGILPSNDEASEQKFAWLTTSYMAPFRAFTGIEQGAQAVREFAGVADRFTSVVQGVPEQSRWQLELLLYDLERHQTVASLVGTLAGIADTAESLPAAIRGELSGLLAELEGSQSAFQATLRDAQATLVEARETLAGLDQTTRSLEETSHNVATAGNAWGDTLRVIDKWVSGPPGSRENVSGESAPRPLEAKEQSSFDITEYEATAKAIGAAGVELRALLSEAHDVTESNAVTNRLIEVTRSLMDRVFWRALLLVVGIGLTVLFVRGTTRRWLRSP